MNLTKLMMAAGKAFIVSVVLTPIVRDIFRSYNVVDRPGRRKVHVYPIPRVGGVSIMIAYVVALMSLRGPGSPFPMQWLETILSGALIIFLTGLIDDFVNLKPTVKLMGQIAAAAIAFASGIRIDNVGGVALPVWIGMPVTVFWLLLTTNALNLIDGLDGLCAGIGFWAALAFFAATLVNDSTALAYTVLPLAGALLGFLLFNFKPATVFLGDSGALLTGFLLGCFGIIWTGHRLSAAGAAFPLFALCVPIMDLGSSIVRRVLKDVPIFSADRGHVHHLLLDRGMTVRRTALALYAAQIIGGIFGLALSYLALRHPGAWHGIPPAVVLVAAAATTVAGIRHLRYAEFEVIGYLLFRGEFRSVFAQKLRMQKLAQSLERAAGVEEWWRSLAVAAGEEKWIRVVWMAGNRKLREEVLDGRKPSWSFAIDLDAEESIHVEGDERTARGSSDLISFSLILSRSFIRVRREWEQTALL